jgi:hypothetical protein
MAMPVSPDAATHHIHYLLIPAELHGNFSCPQPGSCPNSAKRKCFTLEPSSPICQWIAAKPGEARREQLGLRKQRAICLERQRMIDDP